MIKRKLKDSIRKFDLSLENKIVLTEAATGNYCVTPVIAALGDARVYGYTKDSGHGSVKDVMEQTYQLAEEMGVKEKITIIEDLSAIDLREIDVLTNTGFLRPIGHGLISKLSLKCVIPLMWEPWEQRKEEIDLEACYERGIKIYGTNESDERLRTTDYIGFTVLYFLLQNGLSPMSANVLLVGCDRFVNPVEMVLKQNRYAVSSVTEYTLPVSAKDVDAIVVLEHERNILIIGDAGAAINKKDIHDNTLVIHICGNVEFTGAGFKYIPEEPKPYSYMSFTADYIDNQAVIDLHTAGLKVAEGMLKANTLRLKGLEYKKFMEMNYPALAFDDPKLW